MSEIGKRRWTMKGFLFGFVTCAVLVAGIGYAEQTSFWGLDSKGNTFSTYSLGGRALGYIDSTGRTGVILPNQLPTPLLTEKGPC
jgi:hypothetical protein